MVGAEIYYLSKGTISLPNTLTSHSQAKREFLSRGKAASGRCPFLVCWKFWKSDEPVGELSLFSPRGLICTYTSRDKVG